MLRVTRMFDDDDDECPREYCNSQGESSHELPSFQVAFHSSPSTSLLTPLAPHSVSPLTQHQTSQTKEKVGHIGLWKIHVYFMSVLSYGEGGRGGNASEAPPRISNYCTNQLQEDISDSHSLSPASTKLNVLKRMSTFSRKSPQSPIFLDWPDFA